MCLSCYVCYQNSCWDSCTPKSSISSGLIDANAQTFVYISSYYVYTGKDRHNTQRHACSQEHGSRHCHMELCVHTQGYTVRACNDTSQRYFPWNRICSSKTPNPQTAPAATAWTHCSHLVWWSGYVGWLYGTKLSSGFSWWEQVFF